LHHTISVCFGILRQIIKAKYAWISMFNLAVKKHSIVAGHYWVDGWANHSQLRDPASRTMLMQTHLEQTVRVGVSARSILGCI
jgi:hypothetical protein